MRQVWGGNQSQEERRNAGGKENTGNTGEEEVQSDNKMQEDITTKGDRKTATQEPKTMR